jgi:hypothetical protein
MPAVIAVIAKEDFKMNSNKFQVTGTPEYDRHFWNAMRGVKESVSNL